MIMAAGCRENEAVTAIPSDDREAIAFSLSVMEEEQQTRANVDLARDFTVFGYKSDAAAGGGSLLNPAQPVFEGYHVTYEAGSENTTLDNSDGYGYVGGTSLDGIAQTIKYWDFSAAEYHFWAITDGRCFQPNGSGVIDGTMAEIPLVMTTHELTEPVLFSRICHRGPVTNETVQLLFRRPNCKISVRFFSGEPLSEGHSIRVSYIRFAPDPEDASDPNLAQVIYTDGTLLLGYYPQCGTSDFNSHNEETIKLRLNGPTQPHLSFQDVVLDHTHGTASNNAVIAPNTAGDDYYYLLPMGEEPETSPGIKNPDFMLSVNVDGTEPKNARTAYIPAQYMQWRANHQYTYIFKIIDGGNRIDLYDVFIDPWRYGGYGEDEWRNW